MTTQPLERGATVGWLPSRWKLAVAVRSMCRSEEAAVLSWFSLLGEEEWGVDSPMMSGSMSSSNLVSLKVLAAWCCQRGGRDSKTLSGGICSTRIVALGTTMFPGRDTNWRSPATITSPDSSTVRSAGLPQSKRHPSTRVSNGSTSRINTAPRSACSKSSSSSSSSPAYSRSCRMMALASIASIGPESSGAEGSDAATEGAWPDEKALMVAAFADADLRDAAFVITDPATLADAPDLA
mmetsp:Transcript_52049/g.123914  ORF Transcript_52049/g.123914 Transcript_52049/m.123914 type:complete len:238 (+) Transcript_52049:45-758(+)